MATEFDCGNSLTAKIWAREVMKKIYLDSLFRVRMSFVGPEWRNLWGPVTKDIEFCVAHIKMARKYGWLNYYKMKEKFAYDGIRRVAGRE
jgi:hypothetical protein